MCSLYISAIFFYGFEIFQNKSGKEKLGVSKTFPPICSEVKGKKALGGNKKHLKRSQSAI